MNVLITGISGSGGSYLAEHIVNNYEANVFGTTRWHSSSNSSNTSSIEDKITLIECDLMDLSSIIRAIEISKPEKIFHLASLANVRKCFDTPISVYQNNVLSTMNLLEAIRLSKLDPVVQICSSSEVYGNPQEFPMTENHPLKPVNPYAASKLAQESLAYSYFKSWGMKIVITRAFTYINPRRKDLFATSFALQVARIEKGLQDVLKHGNLESVRTIIDIRDIMDAYWIASEKCEYGQDYNIGGEMIISVGEFLDLLKKFSNVEIKSEVDPDLLRPVDVTKQVPNMTKFKERTGWGCKYSKDDIVINLLNYCREIV